ncbi:MAG TPA: GIY-YIG nuclease family protein [Candidatus Bathyarchaeia archaeon]|nr:GIY-YIG nuclease family protein [Candidatus Bathyarchaeia archaeon]
MRRERLNRGTYALLVRVPHTVRIPVGSLGPLTFKRGFYVYVGSALNSLRGRIARHFRRDKQVHWHIDYLTVSPSAKLIEAWASPTPRRTECSKSRMIRKHASESIKRFGASDCDCYSHLHHFDSLKRVRRILSAGGFK